MSKKISSNLIQKELMKMLTSYKDDISEIVEKDANKIGKEATEELKKISPEGARKQYSKGWKLKKEKKDKNRYSVKLYNSTDYKLTHLLEFGHATRDGGYTQEQPHIRPTEKKYSNKFEKKLKEDLGGLKK